MTNRDLPDVLSNMQISKPTNIFYYQMLLNKNGTKQLNAKVAKSVP